MTNKDMYDVSYVDALARGIKKYVTFSGRASRSEFWRFMAAEAAITSAFNLLYCVVALIRPESTAFYTSYALSMLCALFFLLPGLSISCRRLHDIGKSGWMVLLGIIPVVGQTLLFYYFLLPRQEEGDIYGPATAYTGGLPRPREASRPRLPGRRRHQFPQGRE